MTWWPFTRRETLLVPGVQVQEVDFSVHPIVASPNAAVLGSATPGPLLTPVYIGPSVRKPRWWEVWRWHQYPRWRRESRAAWKKYREVFGTPNAAQAEAMRHYYDAPNPILVVRAKPTEPPPESKP